MSPAEKLALSRPAPKPRKPGGTRTKHWSTILRKVREGYRLSQDEVCGALNMSKGGYSEIENGSDPQLTTAWKIAAFFGMRIEQLWKPLEGGSP